MQVKPLLSKINSKTFLQDYLSACGVEDPKAYLKANLSVCDSPWDYPNMIDGVDRLQRAIKLNQKIGIVVDEDNDGYTSASIMYMFIKRVRPEHDVMPIFHASKSHGIVQNQTEDVVKTAIDNGVKLLICPDSASNDMKQCKYLRHNGVCVLILDHHEITTFNPYAILINHHNWHDLNIHLSGCGVTFKFIQACAEKWNVDIGDDYYDLVASSIVSDNCSMVTPENFALIKYGFKHMTNPMLIAMYENFNNVKRGNTPNGVAWGMAPRVNAITRAGTQEEKHMLFNAFVGEGDIDQAIVMAKEAHERQGEVTKQIVKEIKPNLDQNHKVLVGFSDEEHRNYSGLVANKFVGEHGKPTLILRELNANTWSGSVRSPIDIADKINESKIAKCQGHLAACGIYLPKENLDRLIEWFDQTPLDMNPPKAVTGILQPKNITSTLCHACSDDMLLWGGSSGAGIVQPKFYISFETNPKEINIYSKPRSTTVKFPLTKGASIVKFRAKIDDVVNLQNMPCKVECIVTLGINEYNGQEYPQALIESWEVEPIAKKTKVEETEDDWEAAF